MIEVTTAVDKTAAQEIQEDIQRWIDKQIPIGTILSVLLQGAAAVAKNTGFSRELFEHLARVQIGFIFTNPKPEDPGLPS